MFGRFSDFQVNGGIWGFRTGFTRAPLADVIDKFFKPPVHLCTSLPPAKFLHYLR